MKQLDFKKLALGYRQEMKKYNNEGATYVKIQRLPSKVQIKVLRELNRLEFGVRV